MSPGPTVKVYVSSHVRAYTAGQSEVEAEGRTLTELLADLDRRYPGMRFRVVDEQDRIRPHMNFFVGGELVRDLAHPIAPGDDVHILGALSGG
jgi:molybdopterin converting factor small subunit